MYQIGQFVEIEGPLDVPVLADAVARAVAGTDALNMAFGEDHAGPFQLPRPNPAGLDVTDLSGAKDPEAEARVLMDSDLGLARDVVTDELLHTELIKLSDDRHFFYQRVHHLMLDGYSAVLVLQRVAELYHGLLDGTEPRGAAAGSTHPETLRPSAPWPNSWPPRTTTPAPTPPTPTGPTGKTSCGTPRPRQDSPAGLRARPVRWSAPPGRCRTRPPPPSSPPPAPRRHWSSPRPRCICTGSPASATSPWPCPSPHAAANWRNPRRRCSPTSCRSGWPSSPARQSATPSRPWAPPSAEP